MKTVRWAAAALLLIAFVVIDLLQPLPVFLKWLAPVMLAAFVVLVRLGFGPLAPDRAVALKTLGLIIVSVCGLLAALLKRDLYIDIALAWAIQSFVVILIIGKFIEGRSTDA